MSNQDAYGYGPGGDEYRPGPGQVPGRHDPEPEPGQYGGYGSVPGPGQGYAPDPGHPQGHDAGYGQYGGYPHGQGGYGQGYGQGPGQGYGPGRSQGYGPGGPLPGGPYVPEPMGGQPSLDGGPSAAFGASDAVDSWTPAGHAPGAEPGGYAMGGQPSLDGGPSAAFGAPDAVDSWTPAGHAPGVEPGGYGGPVAGDGWGRVPAGPQPWEAGPPGTWEHGGAGGYAYGGAPAREQGRDRQPQGYPEPHAYAQPHAYAPGPAGIEHTAVLPVIEEEPAEPVVPAAPGTPQAPVRTGSPIIPPGIQPAAVTAALGLLMAGGAAVGHAGLAVFLVVLQAVTAAGWFRLNGMWPARQGIVLAFASGVTADAAVLAVNGDHGPFALAGVLGVWLLLVLVLQLRHHGSADERLSSLTATSVSTLLTVLAASYLATATSHAGTDAVVVGAIAVVAATVVRALPLPGGDPVSIPAALAAAAATGLATGPATGFGGGHAALLAAACGICALIGLRVASYDFPSRFVHFTAGVALPLTAAAPVVYALGRVLA